MAEWTTAYINDLPDSCFLYIEPGGTKEDGKTVPRSLRHFPVKDAAGNVDMPHLRNALSRIPQSSLPQDVKDRITKMAERMMSQMESTRNVDEFDERSSETWDEVRFRIEPEGSGFTMEGPLALFDTPSRILSIADLSSSQSRGQLERFGKRTFREIIHPGAFAKSLSESPDIVLHYQHDERSLPLGRTKAGTLTLTEEGRMVRARAELPDNEWGRPVRDAVKRGDIGGISFRMGAVQDWWGQETLSDGYTGPVRHLKEIRLRREVSLVTFPGYDTPASVRALAEEAEVEPDELAEVFTVLRTPDAKLDDRQHELLQTVIAAKVEKPYLNPTLIQKREQLDALAAG